MYFLGISAYYHDSAAVLVRDGVLIAAVQEERFSRIKHDNSFPEKAIAYCLQQGSIGFDKVDQIVFYDKPFPKIERVLESFFTVAPQGVTAFIKNIPNAINNKIFLKSLLLKELNSLQKGKVRANQIAFSEHHLSHAAWAYFTSPFQESAILTIDGVGEWATTTIFSAKGNQIEVIKEQHFPHSVGLLYSSFTQYLGFQVNDGEYKMMGLAPYGSISSEEFQRFKLKIISEIVEVHESGGIKLNMKYFDFLRGHQMVKPKKWENLFGLKQRSGPESINQSHCNLALACQVVTEEIILKLVQEAKRITGNDKVCLAGGVAYNCVANGRLLSSGIAKELHVPPAVGDSGCAGGAALAAYYLNNEIQRDTSLFEKNRISFLGPSYSSYEIESFLIARDINHEKFNSDIDLAINVAELLYKGAIVGWFSGRMEFGARALGARSILSNPKQKDIQRILNLKIKKRESFRPFAPIMLEEDMNSYFGLSKESPFMGIVSQIKPEFRKSLPEGYMQLPIMDRAKLNKSEFPGITHVDFSSRIQTVDKDTNSKMHMLLSEFKKLSGFSMLINTSFNIKDEPIVCTPDDALGCFLKTEMDYLVIEDYIVSKSSLYANT